MNHRIAVNILTPFPYFGECYSQTELPRPSLNVLPVGHPEPAVAGGISLRAPLATPYAGDVVTRRSFGPSLGPPRARGSSPLPPHPPLPPPTPPQSNSPPLHPPPP